MAMTNRLFYEGRKETTIKIIMKFTYIIGTSFTNFRLFSYEFSIISTFFTFAWEVVRRSPENICWNLDANKAHLTSTRRNSKNGLLGVHLSGSQNYGNRSVLNWDCRMDDDIIHLPVRSNPSNCLFWLLQCLHTSLSVYCGTSLRILVTWFLHSPGKR